MIASRRSQGRAILGQLLNTFCIRFVLGIDSLLLVRRAVAW